MLVVSLGRRGGELGILVSLRVSAAFLAIKVSFRAARKEILK